MTSLVTPLPSTAMMPCSRNADSSVGYTSSRGTGRADTILTVPLILGSRMKLRPVISAAALTTASMSALTKLRVTVSSAADEAMASANSAPAASLAAQRRQLRSGSGLRFGAGPAGRAGIGSGGGPYLGRRRE